jgi:subfamily B ATP-binding cassette protein MsbA
VRFRRVSHRYPTGDADALREVDCEIRAGRTTALVGASGAGKSTLVNLLWRQFDPTAGEILVDGTPLPSLDLEQWRDRIAFVPQDVHLFDATVRENIAYGRLDATDEEIVAVARLAGAHDFILSLPDGYGTRLGERGMRFSGGQRQRIALARALIRDPDILILDEATSALDNLSAALIRDAVATAAEGRTVIVIAHRMSAALCADWVIVLDEGRLAEQGPPAALLATGGAMAKLVDAERLAV